MPITHLALHGVDHTARPTWRLRETIEFYRDKLGLPLVHVISARGWGPSTHPDFLHFFFDSGAGSTIAFFYYLGTDEPAELRDRAAMPPVPDDHTFDATHTAWIVPSSEALLAWKARLESLGLEVSPPTTHEIIESIYVRDPNGYFVEFTTKLRPLEPSDHADADLTLRAALAAEDAASRNGERVHRIDDVWLQKARLLHSGGGPAARGIRLYVPRVPEFRPLLEAAQARRDCRTHAMAHHDLIESDKPLEFHRKTLGLTPALWYGLFTGGLHGRIDVFDRERVLITPMGG